MDLECRASVEKKPVISLRFCCCCGGAAVRERVLSTLEYTLCLQKCAKPWRLYDVDPPQTKLVIYNYDCFCFFEGIFPLTFLFFFLPSFPFYSLIIATLWFRAPVDYLLFFFLSLHFRHFFHLLFHSGGRSGMHRTEHLWEEDSPAMINE